MTGTTIAQVIIVSMSPILTRLYTATDLGVFALYMAIAGVMSIIATGRYELAIMLTKKDEEAAHIVVLSLIIATGVSILLFIIVLTFNKHIIKLLGNPDVSSWLYLVPLTVFLTGAYQSFNYWLNRQKKYKEMSQNRVMQSGITAATQCSTGYGVVGPSGLIAGILVGQSVTTALIFRGFWKWVRHQRISYTHIKSQAKQYIDHPKLLVPSHGISMLSTQLPIFFLSSFFGNEAAGFFSLASRVISLPSSLIANAIGDVFRQRATAEYHKYGEFKNIYIKTLKNTFSISIIPFTLFFFFSPFIFACVFGDVWRRAGEYVQILAISFFFGFIFTPIDKAALIVGAVRYIFWWHFLRLLANVLIVVITVRLNFKINMYLYLFVFINTCFYITEGVAGYKFCKKYESNE